MQYKRAINAAKIEKMFQKPFLWSLEGHMDGLTCTGTSPTSVVAFVSGAADGELRVWDLAHKRCLWSARAHSGAVHAVGFLPEGDSILSCGDDGCVKQWSSVAPHQSSSSSSSAPAAAAASGGEIDPTAVWSTTGAIFGLSVHPTQPMFATCTAAGVGVWNMTRSAPTVTLGWGGEHAARKAAFNLADPHLIAAAGEDRRLTLYDIRQSAPIRQVEQENATNAVAWNPREPMNFLSGNEDHCAYSWDMRKLDSALVVHKDHVSAVMDVSWSPTGREFATASYDKTVRIWNASGGSSKQVYHTKRMQRVWTVDFTRDSKYIVSGSDDTNLRVWKADASAVEGVQAPRARAKVNYNKSLLKRYAHMPEVKRIVKQQYVPKYVSKASKRARDEDQKEAAALANINRHSKTPRKPTAEKKRSIVAQHE